MMLAITPGSQLAFQFIPKVFDGVEVGLCAGHTDLDKPFLYGPRFVHGGHCHPETGKGLLQTVAAKLEAQNHLEWHCLL